MGSLQLKIFGTHSIKFTCPLNAMNISIIILSLLSLGGVSFSFQHTINAICFDLEGNDGSDLSSEETNCNIYVMNNGIVTSEKGIENDHADDCIGMHKPDPNQHTYVW